MLLVMFLRNTRERGLFMFLPILSSYGTVPAGTKHVYINYLNIPLLLYGTVPAGTKHVYINYLNIPLLLFGTIPARLKYG